MAWEAQYHIQSAEHRAGIRAEYHEGIGLRRPQQATETYDLIANDGITPSLQHIRYYPGYRRTSGRPSDENPHRYASNKHLMQDDFSNAEDNQT